MISFVGNPEKCTDIINIIRFINEYNHSCNSEMEMASKNLHLLQLVLDKIKYYTIDDYLDTKATHIFPAVLFTDENSAMNAAIQIIEFILKKKLFKVRVKESDLSDDIIEHLYDIPQICIQELLSDILNNEIKELWKVFYIATTPESKLHIKFVNKKVQFSTTISMIKISIQIAIAEGATAELMRLLI
ncbi:hypothetical protein C1646_763639 [Rhizophagus diaphanus]|nr:hypothetical protein C1646_763639 [Rhizophagus diaphanus] [Rhizophagus sp. MUCL 43196]